MHTEIGKYLALILRHKPEVIGITLDKNGWADVKDLINGIKKKYTSFDETVLAEIVATDSKQRYSFNSDKTKIRANQGHSVRVDVELQEIIPPAVLYHGTGQKYIESINEQGLIPKSRLHVHLSSDTETALNVGQRHGTPAIYVVNAEQMYKDGYKFYLSANRVYLTDKVPAQYLQLQ